MSLVPKEGSRNPSEEPNFVCSSPSCTSSDDDNPRQNVKVSEDLTKLLVAGLKFNGAKLPDTFAPFVDKNQIGSLPMKPVNQAVVGYRSPATMGPRVRAIKKRPAGNRRKKVPKRKQVNKPAPPAEDSSDNEKGAESEKVHSKSEDTSSGIFLSSVKQEKKPVVAETKKEKPVVGLVKKPVLGQIKKGKPAVGKTMQDKPEIGEIKKPVIGEIKKGKPAIGEIKQDKPLVGEIKKGKPAVGEIKQDKPLVGEIKKGKPAVGEITQDKPLVGEIKKRKPAVGEIKQDKPAVAFMKEPVIGHIKKEKPVVGLISKPVVGEIKKQPKGHRKSS